MKTLIATVGLVLLQACSCYAGEDLFSKTACTYETEDSQQEPVNVGPAI